MTGEELRRQLVAALRAQGALGDERVAAAFLAVPRERFLPEVAAGAGLEAVYADRAVVTQTDARTGAPTSSSSQPAVMAAMLEALDVRPGHRILEIGAGTGYNAALLAVLAQPGGSVTSVEIDPDLASRASHALAGTGVRVEAADGYAGWSPGAPYDRIIATASTTVVPRAWFDQLAPAGVLVVPLRLAGHGVQAIVAFQKGGDRLRSVAVVPGGFMAMRGAAPDDDRAPAPHLTVTFFDGARERVLAAVTGPGLAGMQPGATRRLAALLLGPPRARAAALPTPPDAFLALWEPERNRTVYAFVYGDEGVTSGTGTVTPDGESAAFLVRRRGTPATVEAYGRGDAEADLGGMLDEWEARGRPGPADLVVEVRFDGGAAGQISTVSWRR